MCICGRVVIKATNLGNELRKAFTIGCQWSVPVSKVIKVTNWENMMNFGDELRGCLTWIVNGVCPENCDEYGELSN